MAIWEFNRGEWTEAYVFLRLLGEGRIYGATTDLVKDDLTYVDIINVIRDEPDKLLIFERFIKDEIAYVQSYKGEEKLKIVTAPELTNMALFFYDKIKQVASGDRKFNIPELQEYLEGLSLDSPKAKLSDNAKKTFGAKTDIILTTEDSFDHVKATSGFSIKSHIGSSPTLFNSSQTSGFVFKIIGCDFNGMNHLNYQDGLMDIISAIKKDYSLKYVGCRNDVFEQNLGIVDSRMDEILQNIMLLHTGYLEGSISKKVPETSQALAILNPLKVGNPEVFYEAKLKAFLFSSFAGLTASTKWDGRKKITGGYIDVDREGDLLYYRAISDDIFESYLFNHTFFDNPDRGVNKDIAIKQAKVWVDEGRSLNDNEMHEIIYDNEGKKYPKKGDFGYVYQEGDDFYIAINFQIRFR